MQAMESSQEKIKTAALSVFPMTNVVGKKFKFINLNSLTEQTLTIYGIRAQLHSSF